MPESLKDVSLLLEIISAWWDFHDFDANGNEVAVTGHPPVNEKCIWTADVMIEKFKPYRPPALVESPNVRAHNAAIQDSIAIQDAIEIDSDSD